MEKENEELDRLVRNSEKELNGLELQISEN
jgi:hypothetical protein